MKICKVCGNSTYKPKQRIYTKYCGMLCRNNDPEYWNAISKTKKFQIITDEQKQKISDTLKRRFADTPKKRGDLSKLNVYRNACAFKFNLADYKDKFDFSLIEEFGWYSPSNKKNNLNGISRDHLVSVKFGFINSLPPEHLSHPANCKLVKHSDNIKKNAKCEITYNELLYRISQWDN